MITYPVLTVSPLKFVAGGMCQGIQRDRCYGFYTSSTALANTPLSGLRMRERWMEYAQDMFQSEMLRSQQPIEAFTWPLYSVGIIVS